ncbi:hypothetical protein BT93_I1353 [Corymbia citriodora subsp. variegata]|nr:hypothetical protein BT93_I1353 [Corymbia citriodora subsp. variegata]
MNFSSRLSTLKKMVPRDTEYSAWASYIGVAIVLMAILFDVWNCHNCGLAFGFAQAVATRKGCIAPREGEEGTLKLAAKIFMTTTTMGILVWAIYTGHKLATKP